MASEAKRNTGWAIEEAEEVSPILPRDSWAVPSQSIASGAISALTVSILARHAVSIFACTNKVPPAVKLAPRLPCVAWSAKGTCAVSEQRRARRAKANAMARPSPPSALGPKWGQAGSFAAEARSPFFSTVTGACRVGIGAVGCNLDVKRK